MDIETHENSLSVNKNIKVPDGEDFDVPNSSDLSTTVWD